MINCECCNKSGLDKYQQTAPQQNTSMMDESESVLSATEYRNR